MTLPAGRGLYNPPAFPAPLGMYSHVGHAAASNVVFLAGQLSVDGEGKLVGKDDFALQVETAFANLGALLTSIAASFDQVISFNTYLCRPADVDTFFTIRRELFPRLFSKSEYPPNNLFVLQQLFHPDYLFEIVAVAALDLPAESGER
jgi:enamine deaminase RidA (YjgF/YER057c/UK114 family)